MRDEFSKHRCPGQEWRRLLEAAEKTVSRYFLCLGFVVSRSVMPAELSGVICGGIVLLPHVNVGACSEKNLLDRADRVFCINNYHSHVMAIW